MRDYSGRGSRHVVVVFLPGRPVGARRSRASKSARPDDRPARATGRQDQTMKFTGDISIDAPPEAVFAKVRDARFFASCVEGVQDLSEIDPDHYTAVLETKVAYLKFKFNVAVEVVRADPPREIEAKIEGTPLGIVGRLSARSLTRLAQDNGGTKVSYEIDAALTGKLGSLGQPVLRAKAKEMERAFAERMRAAFAGSKPASEITT
jgi:carbon monoxide dehydrogenase subunit G